MKKLTNQHANAIATEIFNKVTAKAELLYGAEIKSLKEAVLSSKEVEDFKAQVKAQLPMLKLPTLSIDSSNDGWYIYEIVEPPKGFKEVDPHKVAEVSIAKFIERQQQRVYVSATFTRNLIRYKNLEISREDLIDKIWLWDIGQNIDQDFVDLFIKQTVHNLLREI